MASMDNEENKGKGAAEEPDPPEPDDASSAAAAASYDPTIYQRPHPDDRGGSVGKKKGGAAKARDKSSVGKGAAEEPEPEPDDASCSTAATKTKSGKAKDDGTHRCANCDKPGAKKRCGRCGVEWYCDHNCQKVRGCGAAGSRVAQRRCD